MLIYQITLPQDQDAAAFITFMSEQYIPAVHMGPTRVGQVSGLTLLQSAKDKQAFFLHVGWGGISRPSDQDADWDDLPRIDGPNAEQIERTFNSFGAQLQNFSSYYEVATSLPNE